MEPQLWDHWDAMVRAARLVLGSVDDAQDCASEVITRFLEQQPGDVMNLEAFLVTVTKRRAVDYVRARAHAQGREARVAREASPIAIPDLADEIASRAEAAWADAEARRVLAPHLYALLQLIAEGVPPAVIAARLGISEHAVESRLLRARRKVRAALSKAVVAVGLGVEGIRRWLTPASATAVVAASFVLAVPESAPLPAEPRATAPALRLMPIVGALDQRADGVQQGRVRPAPNQASPAGGAGGATATRILPPTADARTPLGGTRIERRQDNHRSSGPLAQIMRCVENLRVEVGYQGCGPREPGPATSPHSPGSVSTPG